MTAVKHSGSCALGAALLRAANQAPAESPRTSSAASTTSGCAFFDLNDSFFLELTTSIAQGYDKGLSYKFKRDKVGGWSINTMMTWPTYLHLNYPDHTPTLMAGLFGK